MSRDPEGNVMAMEYDLHGNMTRLVDPRGKETLYTYETGGCSSCGSGGGGQLLTIEDHDGNVTAFEYDEHGNRTKVTDALNRETDFAYDSRNRLITVTSPSGSSNVMTYEYNRPGRMIKSTSFEGEETTYEYDHMGRTTKVTRASISNWFTYTGGLLTKVKDGLNHEWTYAYDSSKRLTTLTDPVGKITKYFYDSQGRMTKVGAGSSGTFDPTEYVYSGTTGQLTKTKYTAGANVDEAIYVYDANGQLTVLGDWIDTTNGLQYSYDDAGRLTALHDYDSDDLTYVCGDAGNVTPMTDDHSYTMAYTYDSRNRMTKIEHKDGAVTVRQSFEHTLDDDVTSTKITRKDRSYRDYAVPFFLHSPASSCTIRRSATRARVVELADTPD